MTGPAPAVAATRTAVRTALDRLPPGAGVLVACSGGPDSLALAAATAFVAPRSGYGAGAVVVDHGLQPGSAQVADRAADQCRELGLDPVLVVPVHVAGPGGTEAAARDVRYAAFEAAARRTGAVAVLLGHTLDDQAEQVLLGLARGSGPRSLAGMPAARGTLLRPFLTLGREQTQAACDALGLTAWHDPTNRTHGLRSRVRHEVMPLLDDVLGPGVARALVRTADQAREAADVLDVLAAELLAAADPGGTGSWDVDVLAAAGDGVRRAGLRLLALQLGAAGGSLARSHVLALDALLVDWRGQGPVDLPGGPAVGRECGRLAPVRPLPPDR